MLRSLYPKSSRGHLASRGLLAAPVHVLFLLDGSSSMSSSIQAVKNTVSQVAVSLPLDSQVAVMVYSDVGDKDVCRVIAPFASAQSSLSGLVQNIQLQHGQDTAEAQYTAFAASACYLQWPEGGLKLIVHLTDAPPHTREAENRGSSDQRSKEEGLFKKNRQFTDIGLKYDLSNIADHLRELGIKIITLVTSSPSPLVNHPYLLMALKTDFPGFFIVPPNTQAIAQQILLLVSWLNQAAQGGGVGVVKDVKMLVPVDDEHRFKLLTAQDDAEVALGAAKQLTQASEISALVSGALASLVRTDGNVERFRHKEISPEEYESQLKQSAQALQTNLKAILAETTEDGPECALTLLSLREAVTVFIEIGAQEKDLKKLFENVSSLVLGRPMCLPHTGGQFNFESAWDLHVHSVKGSHWVNYQAFLDHQTAVTGYKQVERKEDIPKVDDIFRDGQNTGVLPCTDGSPLGNAVLRALAQTPWLEVITWHSVCRHALAVPNAVSGTLACALKWVLSQGKPVNWDNLSAAPVLSSLQQTLVSNITQTLHLLPLACTSLRLALAAYLQNGETDIRTILAVQAGDVEPTKVLCVLAQMNLTTAVHVQDLALALIGEIFAGGQGMNPHDFLKLFGHPVIDLTDTERWIQQCHSLELSEGQLPEYQVPAYNSDTRFLQAVSLTVAGLRACGWNQELEWSGVILNAVYVETLFIGPRQKRATISAGVCSSQLQPIPNNQAQAQKNLDHYLRVALRDRYAKELKALGVLRQKDLITKTVVPKLAEAVLSGDLPLLLQLLHQPWENSLVDKLTFCRHHVSELLEFLKAQVIQPAIFLILVCGRSKLGEPVVWSEGQGGPTVLDATLVAPNHYQEVMTTVLFHNHRSPGISAALPGTNRFNRSAVKCAVQVRRLLGLPPLLVQEQWLLTPELVSLLEEKKSEGTGSFPLLVKELGPALFLCTRQKQLILWSLGPITRQEVRTAGKVRYPWPDPFIADRRKWHVRTFWKNYQDGLPFVQGNKDVRNWEIPQAEVDKLVESLKNF